PPFTTGGIAEKLIQHQLDEPEPVERLRPEVSPALAAILRRLMAKAPEKRYQTPAELVVALDNMNKIPLLTRSRRTVRIPPHPPHRSAPPRPGSHHRLPPGRRPPPPAAPEAPDTHDPAQGDHEPSAGPRRPASQTSLAFVAGKCAPWLSAAGGRAPGPQLH